MSETCEKYSQIFKAYQKGLLELQSSEFKRLKNESNFARQYKAFLVNLAQDI